MSSEHLKVGWRSQLDAQGLFLITKVRKNMRERLLVYSDKLLLRKRALIESINDN